MSMKGSRINSIAKHTFLIIVLILTMFPIIYTILASFKSNKEILSHPEWIFPRELTFENYIKAWNSDSFSIKSMLFNSIYYTLICVIINLITSSMSGFVFERGFFYGKKVIFAVFSLMLFVAIGSITIYPYFEVLNLLNIPRSLPALLIIKCFGIPVANIYLVRGFVSNIPKEIDEAARIDGCSFARLFFSIILPMLTPILATIGILSFQASWNEYLMPTIFTMTKPSQRTLIVGVVALKSTGEAASSWNLMLAGSTIAIVPVLIAYAFGNKYFVQGIMSGAIKG